MTVLTALSQTWVEVDTTAADVLVSPVFYSGFVLELWMGGATPPKDISPGHILKQPFLLPKGVGAWIRGRGDVHISPFAAK